MQANEPYLSQHDILGLRKSIVTYIYPFSLANWQCVFSIYDIQNGKLGYAVIRDKKGNQVFRVDFSTFDHGDDSKECARNSMLIPIGEVPSWSTIIVPMTDVLIYEPQVLSIYYGEVENEYSIGQIAFGLALQRYLMII